MVELVRDFEDLKEHAAYAREILYKIDEVGDQVRIRVRVGRFGWDRTVRKEDARPILEWLEANGAIEIVGAVETDLFFA